MAINLIVIGCDGIPWYILQPVAVDQILINYGDTRSWLALITFFIISGHGFVVHRFAGYQKSLHSFTFGKAYALSSSVVAVYPNLWLRWQHHLNDKNYKQKLWRCPSDSRWLPGLSLPKMKNWIGSCRGCNHHETEGYHKTNHGAGVLIHT